MENRPDATEPQVSLEDLERERLRTYVDWAEVRAPWWYWPAYALAVAAWLAGYGLGPLWGAGGALLVVVLAAVGLRVTSSRGQVSMPRFRGMPAPLKRAYLPLLAAGLWLVGVLLLVAFIDSMPHLLLGAVTGVVMALAGVWTSYRYRAAARRLADEAGLGR